MLSKWAARRGSIPAYILLVPALLTGPVFAGNASAAKGRLNQAKSYSDEGRIDQADEALNAAEKFLDGLGDSEKAPIEKDIKELRGKLDTTRKAQESQRVERNVNRTLDFADSESVPGNAQRMIESAIRTFEGDDGKKNLTDEARKRLQSRIDAMKKKYGMATGDAGTTTPETPKKPDTTAGNTTPETKKPETAVTAVKLDEEGQRIFASINRTINYANDESNPSSAENFLEQARTQLAKGDTKAKLDADTIKKLQERIDAAHAKFTATMKSDEARRLVEYMESQLRAAEGSIASDPGFAQTRLNDVGEHLQSEEYKTKLDAATLNGLEDKRSAIAAKLGGSNKAMALSRAEPILKELEQKVASDPYQGVAVDQTYKVVSELNSLRTRVMDKVGSIPADDADRKAIEARLAAVARKIEGYDSAWGDARVEEAIANNWKFSRHGFEGWDKEAYSPGQRPFAPLEMNKTIQAIRFTNHFLEEKDTKEAREKHGKLPKVNATIADAEKTLADAAEKLNTAFNQWLDAAEKQPRPQGTTRFDIDSASLMAHNAEDWFAGTRYKDPNVARARRLDERWQAEIAAIEKQHAEALKKLTADASAAWPKIDDSIRAEDSFNPSDAASSKGKTIRLKGVRNRSGWDFDGRYDFVMWQNGVPIAGNYEPKVAKAFADASSQIGDAVNDHADWDVIAIVEGPGTVNHRVTSQVKAANGDVLGKIESYPPMDCVRVKVIAVHAGPVAVGP
jgi:hypothetical protein